MITVYGRFGSIIVVIGLWILVYFGAQRLGKSRARVVQPSRLDRRVPVWEWSIVVYSLAYLYPFVLLWFVPDDAIDVAVRCYALLVLCAGVFYVLFPTEILRIREPRSPLLAALYWLDKTTNCIPSLHSASALLTTCFLAQYRPAYLPIGLLGTLAISASSICVRQHYLLDILSGYFLSIAVYVVVR